MTLDKKAITAFFTAIVSIVSLMIMCAVVFGLMGCAALQKDKVEVKKIVSDAIDDALVQEPKNVPPQIAPPALTPEVKTVFEKKDV